MTTTEPTDELLDAVGDVLTDSPQTPSGIARKAKVTTGQAAWALRWLVAHQFAATEGNGGWARYRRFTARDVLR